jgi:hypothetical protein
MPEADDAERHVPYSAVEAYAQEQVSGVWTVAGVPESRIQLSPAQHTITLLVEVVDNVGGPGLNGLANLDYSLEDVAGTMWHRLDVTYEDNLAEVYPVLCTVVDRVQVKGESFAVWVRSWQAAVDFRSRGRSVCSAS